MVYKLRYKKFGGPKEILFESKDYESACALAQLYCKKFNYKFASVAPLYVNLEAEIKRKNDEEFAQASKRISEKNKQSEARKANELDGLNDVVNELGKKKTE